MDGSWGLRLGGQRRKDTCGEAIVAQFQALYTYYGMDLECSRSLRSLAGGTFSEGYGTFRMWVLAKLPAGGL